MACCATILPDSVFQYEGPYYIAIGVGTALVYQQGWAWSPTRPEQDFDGESSTFNLRNDFDEAYNDMQNPIVVDFPEELKVECYHVNHADEPESFTFRFEWPDSHDCGGDGPQEGLSARIQFRVNTCKPVRLKARCVGRVEHSRETPDTSFFFATAKDYCRVSVANISLFDQFDENFDPGECDNDTGFKALAGGCAEGTGEDCEMIDRVGCGVWTLCEGAHILLIEAGTGDALQHVDGFWEVTLTFDCAESPTVNCTAEEADENFTEPCGEVECEEGEAVDGECPPPQPETPGDCLCGQCTLWGIRLTVEGLQNSGCSTPSGPKQNRTADLNGIYTLIWDASESHWETNIGVFGSQSTPGIAIQIEAVDSGTPIDLLEVFCYRITGQINCTLDGPTPLLTGSAQFWVQCRERASGSSVGTFVSCGTFTSCFNLAFTKLIAQETGDLCSLSATYSNDNSGIGGHMGNVGFFIDTGGSMECICVEQWVVDPPGSVATIKLEPIGVGGEC